MLESKVNQTGMCMYDSNKVFTILHTYPDLIWNQIININVKVRHVRHIFFTINVDLGDYNTCLKHIWDLPVLRYHKIMVIYPYPFLVVITQLFSCIIFNNDCICILTGSPG